MSEWFYAQGREKKGPVPQTQLVEFLKLGVVTPGTLVWNRSMEQWLPAAQVPGLLNPAPEPAPQAPAAPAATPEPAAPEPAAQTPDPAAGGNPWDTEFADADLAPETQAAGAQQAEAPQPLPDGEKGPTPATRAPTASLQFSAKRPVPEHKRAGARIKNLIARVAAVVIALGILGGGGYLGAEYLGLFSPDIEPRMRYVPDNPDFFVTLNVPKAMAVARSVNPSMATTPTNLPMGTLPIGPDSLQDITVAGNIGEKRWVAVATLSRDFDIAGFFPGTDEPDSTRAGGTKIYYDRDMADFGMDFGVAMPSKTTLLVGPLETLKSVLKRRHPPVVPDAFRPLIGGAGNASWFAGAADIQSLWRVADDLPVDLDEKGRWLMESLDKATFTLGGSGEYDFELVAHCRQAKDAEVIAGEARKALAKQREELLELFVQMGRPVTGDTLSLFDNPEITVGQGGAITFSQRITREMLEEGGKLFTPTGAAAGL